MAEEHRSWAEGEAVEEQADHGGQEHLPELHLSHHRALRLEHRPECHDAALGRVGKEEEAAAKITVSLMMPFLPSGVRLRFGLMLLPHIQILLQQEKPGGVIIAFQGFLHAVCLFLDNGFMTQR